MNYCNRPTMSPSPILKKNLYKLKLCIRHFKLHVIPKILKKRIRVSYLRENFTPRKQ